MMMKRMMIVVMMLMMMMWCWWYCLVDDAADAEYDYATADDGSYSSEASEVDSDIE